ncbi:hypothetical protein Aperf_G00000019879 [Anoplocephala perfoliata]
MDISSASKAVELTMPIITMKADATKKLDNPNRLFPEFCAATTKAKNVVPFLSDAMVIPTLSVTKFDRANKIGEAITHPFEDREFGLLCRTYVLETMVTDSASSATAYLRVMDYLSNCSPGFILKQIGLVSPSHLPYELDKPENNSGLYDLAKAAMEGVYALSEQINLSDLLLIVTAEHSHFFELVDKSSSFRSLFLLDLIKAME